VSRRGAGGTLVAAPAPRTGWPVGLFADVFVADVFVADVFVADVFVADVAPCAARCAIIAPMLAGVAVVAVSRGIVSVAGCFAATLAPSAALSMGARSRVPHAATTARVNRAAYVTAV
jgi:hypothetical protein